MQANELRELADLAQDGDLAKHGRRQVADYLRACADALEAGPVAWARNDGTTMANVYFRAWASTVRDDERARWMPLYPLAMPASSHPAPSEGGENDDR